MSENPELRETPTEATGPSPEEVDAAAVLHEHDDKLVDEWEEESFPASDPPSNY